MAKTTDSCSHQESAPYAAIDVLHESQAGSGRHKCVTCAYNAGYRDAQAGKASGQYSETCERKQSAPVATITALPDSQAGHGRHKCAICAYRLGFNAYAEEFARLEKERAIFESDRDDSETGSRNLVEVKRFAYHRRLERDQSVTRTIKAQLGLSCECCALVLEDAYGALGKGYIEAHHRIPLSALNEGESREVSSKDFAALCPNCHRMIHRLSDVSDIAALRTIFLRAKK